MRRFPLAPTPARGFRQTIVMPPKVAVAASVAAEAPCVDIGWVPLAAAGQAFSVPITDDARVYRTYSVPVGYHLAGFRIDLATTSSTLTAAFEYLLGIRIQAGLYENYGSDYNGSGGNAALIAEVSPGSMEVGMEGVTGRLITLTLQVWNYSPGSGVVDTASINDLAVYIACGERPAYS